MRHPLVDGPHCINSQTISRVCTTDRVLAGQIGERFLRVHKIGVPCKVGIFDEVVVLLWFCNRIFIFLPQGYDTIVCRISA